jgi:hypothetical protein
MMPNFIVDLGKNRREALIRHGPKGSLDSGLSGLNPPRKNLLFFRNLFKFIRLHEKRRLKNPLDTAGK